MVDNVMGSAYLTVHAITAALKKEIAESIDDIDTKGFDVVGDEAGKRIGRKISERLQKDNEVDKAGGPMGEKLARSFSRSFSTSLAGLFGGAFKVLTNKIVLIGGALTLLGSLASAATAAVGGLAGALLQASKSAGAAVPVLGSLIQTALVGKLAFSGFTEAVKGNADAIAKFSPVAREVIAEVQNLEGAWNDLRSAVQDRVFANLAPEVAKLKGVMSSLTPVLEQTGDQINLLLQDMLKWVSSASTVSRLNTALNMNNNIFNQLRQSVTPFLDGMLNLFIALQPAALRLAEAIGNVADKFKAWTESEGFAGRVDAAMRKAEETARSLWDIIVNVGAALKNTFGPAIDVFLPKLERITEKWREWSESVEGQNAIRDWVDEAERALDELGGTIDRLSPILRAVFDPSLAANFFAGFNKSFDFITKPFEGLGASLKESLGKPFADLSTALGPTFTTMGEKIQEILGAVSKGIGEIGTKLGPLFTAIAGIMPLLNPILSLLAKITTFLVKGFIGGIVDAVSGLIGILTGIINVITGLFTGNFTLMWEGVKQIFSGAVQAIWGILNTLFFGKLLKGVGALFSGMGSLVSKGWSAISGFFSQGISGILKTVSSGVANILKFFKELPSKIQGFFSSAGTWLKDAGAKIIDGLINGIKGASALVKKAVDWIVSNIPAWAKKILGIGSPSRVFMTIGNQIAQGLALGIDSGNDQVRSSMKGLLALPSGSGGLSLGDTTSGFSRGGGSSSSSSKSAVVGASSSEVSININNFGPTTGYQNMQVADWWMRFAPRNGPGPTTVTTS